MKVGLYFGSFNPIHVGHLIVASHVANTKLVDQVWFVVSPQNPLKPANSLLNEYKRLNLVHLAIEGDNRFRACDVEFKLPKPSFTIDTLSYLNERYPQHEFSIIMGSDSLLNLHKWKNYEVILENHHIYVYPRVNSGEIDEQFINHAKIHRVGAPVIERSSTFIRESIKNKKNVSPMLPQKVWDYIDSSAFYKK